MPENMRNEFIKLRREIMEADFSQMNPPQREAVLTTNGPLLVLAGAGSGKTTVLVNRIACILKYGNAYYSEYAPTNIRGEDIDYLRLCLGSGSFNEERLRSLLCVDPPPPWGVLAITFTNKAANEMKDRLASKLGEKSAEIWALTFHSACSRILRRDIEKLDMGYTRSFTIYDTDDSVRLLRESCRDIAGDDRSFITKVLLPSISRAKEKNLSPKDYEAAVGGDFRLKKVAQAYYRYQQALQRANALDFDDMLRLTVLLFERVPDVLDYYQHRFKYVLVDEYQDTNNVQYRFVSLLARLHKNLCVVGDDDQSIYKFRGATIENIMSFEHQFDNAKIIKLEQNYRSTSVILDAANSVITNNSSRKGKTLWTSNAAGDRVSVCCFDDEGSESQYIAEAILEDVKNGGTFAQNAVLYRMNAQSGSIEKAFVRNGIAYRIVSGHRLFDSLEIRDILAYLKVINNSRDEISFARVVNVPKRSIGEATVAAALEIAQREDLSLYEVFANCGNYGYFSKKVSRIEVFIEFLEEMRALSGNVPVQELIKAVIVKSGYLGALEAEGTTEAKGRIENLGAFISSAAEYEQTSDEPSLQGFLEEAALMSDIDNYDSTADTVTMMTVHSAKGLEFPVVFIAGLEEGIFPGQNSAYYPEELEEERRLAYVGITRAKIKLHMTYARSRMLFGSTVYNRPSRFIAEIPDDLKLEAENKPIQTKPRVKAAPKPYTITDKSGLSQQKNEGVSYSAGDMLSHNTFGEGMVLSVKPMGGDTLLEIAFEKYGTKKLMANFAKLKKI